MAANLNDIFNNFNEDINTGKFSEVGSNQNDIYDSENYNNCQYYCHNEFNTNFQNTKGLTLMHLNISSLAKHFESLNILLNNLQTKFKIVALTETRIKHGSLCSLNFNLPGYSFISNDTEAAAGGTALYISHTLNSKNRNDLSTTCYVSNKLESTFVEISGNQQANFIVGCIYKHPHFSIDEFVGNYLSLILDKVNKEGKRMVLLGDFNIDLLSYEKSKDVKFFVDTLHSHSVFPTVSLPTRITLNSETLIDNILISSNFNSKYQTGNLSIGISDHLPQFIIIENALCSKYSKDQSNSFYKDWRSFNYNDFQRDFLNINWKTLMRNDLRDPNISFKRFYEKLDALINEHLPLKRLSKNQIKNRNKPWITKGILKSVRKRDNVYKRFMKEKDPIVREILRDQYKRYRNCLVNLIRCSKTNYFKKYFNDNFQNSKNIWKGINDIVTLKSKEKHQTISLEIDKKVENDPKTVSEEFNKFFSTEPGKIAQRIHPTKVSYKSFLRARCQKSFFFTPVDSDEIRKIILQLDINKSNGPYSIPLQILKMMLKELSDVLAIIFNLSLQSGSFIDLLKVVKVIPIYKNKGSPLDIGNYRPISLLSNIDKIFEKVVHARMIKFLEDNNSIFERQFGFRSKHSTNHSLITITETIRESIDKGNVTCGVFLDFQKAFDTVNHEILLEKLKHYGFRGITNNWLRSYLTKRKQFVRIMGYESELADINQGVPQGSVLGPLLFLIYINDISNALLYSQAFIFADDTSLLYGGKNPKRIKKCMNIDLKNLLKWLKSNKISLNVKKTELVLFKQPNKELNYDLKIKLDGKRLFPVKYVKYLGVFLDDNLSWGTHIDFVANKLRRANGILSTIRHFLPISMMRTVYFALFHSQLSYALQVWGQNISTNSRIQRLQKSAARIITFSSHNTHSDPLFKQLNILSISRLIFLSNIKLAHETLNNIAPAAVKDILNLRYVSSSYPTRGALCKLLSRPLVKTTKFGIKSIRYQTVLNWNNLQNEFKGMDLTSAELSKINKLATDFVTIK